MKKIVTCISAVVLIFAFQLCAFASYMTYAVRGSEAVLVRANDGSESINVAESFMNKKITVIGADAFRGNETVNHIVLPEAVRAIEWGAFEDCSALTSVNIPSNVERIEDMTFSGCKGLEDIELPSGIKEIGVRAFANTAIKQLVLPDGLLAINISAFENCGLMSEIVIPDSVVYIGEKAFKGCDNLNVVCSAGSAAEKYMVENHIPYTVK